MNFDKKGYLACKNKLSTQLIPITGLCGKAFLKNKNELIKNKSIIKIKNNKFDFLEHIRKEYKFHFEIYYSKHFDLEHYNVTRNQNYAIIKTKIKIPFIYCSRCEKQTRYRLCYTHNSIKCIGCERKKINKWTSENNLNRLSSNIRSLISFYIKRQGYCKTKKTEQIIGCDFKFFKKYLESKFTEDMNWDNYGKWHLDHIYPVSKAINEKHLIELNHYTNFQPLWAKDNISKNNKIIEHQLKIPI